MNPLTKVSSMWPRGQFHVPLIAGTYCATNEKQEVELNVLKSQLGAHYAILKIIAGLTVAELFAYAGSTLVRDWRLVRLHNAAHAFYANEVRRAKQLARENTKYSLNPAHRQEDGGSGGGGGDALAILRGRGGGGGGGVGGGDTGGNDPRAAGVMAGTTRTMTTVGEEKEGDEDGEDEEDTWTIFVDQASGCQYRVNVRTAETLWCLDGEDDEKGDEERNETRQDESACQQQQDAEYDSQPSKDTEDDGTQNKSNPVFRRQRKRPNTKFDSRNERLLRLMSPSLEREVRRSTRNIPRDKEEEKEQEMIEFMQTVDEAEARDRSSGSGSGSGAGGEYGGGGGGGGGGDGSGGGGGGGSVGGGGGSGDGGDGGEGGGSGDGGGSGEGDNSALRAPSGVKAPTSIAVLTNMSRFKRLFYVVASLAVVMDSLTAMGYTAAADKDRCVPLRLCNLKFRNQTDMCVRGN